MAHYANQKRIILGHLEDIVHRETVQEKWLRPLKWDPLLEAMKILNGNAFKLWFYLFQWEGQGYYDFSPAGISKVLGISDEGARNARQELINKGYLVQNSQNVYEFFPISRTTVAGQKI